MDFAGMDLRHTNFEGALKPRDFDRQRSYQCELSEYRPDKRQLSTSESHGRCLSQRRCEWGEFHWRKGPERRSKKLPEIQRSYGSLEDESSWFAAGIEKSVKIIVSKQLFCFGSASAAPILVLTSSSLKPIASISR
jgi:hypothetical protein